MEDTIPKMIRRLRMTNGWTQAQLAGYAGVSRSTVVRLEDVVEAAGVNFLSLTKVASTLEHDVVLQAHHTPNLMELLEAHKAAFKSETEKGEDEGERQVRRARHKPQDRQ